MRLGFAFTHQRLEVDEKSKLAPFLGAHHLHAPLQAEFLYLRGCWPHDGRGNLSQDFCLSKPPQVEEEGFINLQLSHEVAKDLHRSQMNELHFSHGHEMRVELDKTQVANSFEHEFSACFWKGGV